MGDVVAIGLRASDYAAALLAAGLPIFLLLHGNLLDRSSQRIRSTVRPIALIALALSALHTFVEPVRLAGAWSGIFDPSLQALLLKSDFGTTMGIRALGLILIAGSAWRAPRSGTGLAIIGTVLVAASFALMGHTATDPRRWLLAPLLFVHIMAIAFWFGSLGPLLAVTRVEAASVAGEVVRQFSRTALLVVPLVLLAGLTMSGLLLPGVSALRTPYGISLITKLGGFSLLMALAALNKWRFVPAISRGDRSGLVAFRVSMLAEWVLILAVVAVTAMMTALFSPDH